MKKYGMINSELAKVLSDLGHTDLIMIADVGLPIPEGIKKVDLALKPGFPQFVDVLEEISKFMFIEKAYLADEIKLNNFEVLKKTDSILSNVDKTFVAHDKLKEISKQVKVVIRSGEISPYANVILQSGVDFKELYENYSKTS